MIGLAISLILLAALALVVAGVVRGAASATSREPLPPAGEWQPKPATAHGMRYYYGAIWAAYAGSADPR